MPTIHTVIDLDGYRLRARILGESASATLSKRADRACGLWRESWADCTATECAEYGAIRGELRAWARRRGLDSVALYAADGIYLGTVEA